MPITNMTPKSKGAKSYEKFANRIFKNEIVKRQNTEISMVKHNN